MKFKKTAKKNRSTYKYYGHDNNGKACVLYEFVPETEKDKYIVEEQHRMDDLWVTSNLRTHNVWDSSVVSKYVEEIQRKHERATGEVMSRKEALEELKKVYPKWVLRLEDGDVGGKLAVSDRKTNVLPEDIHLKIMDIISSMSERAQNVYDLYSAGYTQREIAKELRISKKTIGNTMKDVKLALRENAELRQIYSEYTGKCSQVNPKEEEGQ